MAYEPTEWKSGDVVTSAKLNKLENGVANAVLTVHAGDGGVLDKTWQEIYNARYAVVCGDESLGGFYRYSVTSMYMMGPDTYVVKTEAETYITDSADGYPTPEAG